MTALLGRPETNHITPPHPGQLDWQAKALCHGMTREFFPSQGEIMLARQAIRICEHCEVKPECREYALTNREEHGVWGGLSVSERRKELKKRGVA